MACFLFFFYSTLVLNVLANNDNNCYFIGHVKCCSCCSKFFFLICNVELRMSDFNDAEEYSCSACEGDVHYVEQYTFLLQNAALATSSASCLYPVLLARVGWVRHSLMTCIMSQNKPLTFKQLLQSILLATSIDSPGVSLAEIDSIHVLTKRIH